MKLQGKLRNAISKQACIQFNSNSLGENAFWWIASSLCLMKVKTKEGMNS